MAEVTLSIVTPSLNQAPYLPECMRSVREQPVRVAPAGEAGDVEHIVVDGGSTDGSADLIARAPGLAWSVSEPDAGQSDAINKGLARARGEWGGWLNADDWLEPGALGTVIERLRADPSIDVLVGRCRFVDLAGRTIFSPRPPDPITLASLLRLRSEWFNGRLIVQPEAFFRLSLFREVGGLNSENHYTMDHELWLHLLRAGARFATIDQPVACLRAHPEQKTSDNRRIVRCMLRFARPIFEDASRDGSLGAEAEAVGVELAAMDRKLADADLIHARWDAAEAQAPGGPALRAGSSALGPDPGTARSAEPPGESAAQRAGLPGGALEPSRPHARSAMRRLRARGRILALDPSAGKVARALLPELFEGSARGREGQVAIVRDVRSLEAAEPGADAVVCFASLAHAQDPAAVVRRLWSLARPGGRLGLIAETVEAPGLDDYLRRLRALVDAQLSQDHDTLISPAAAPWIDRLRAEAADPQAAERWAQQRPSGRGVDLDALARGVGARVIFRRRYGGLSYHPLAPFPEVEVGAGAGGDSWAVEVWEEA